MLGMPLLKFSVSRFWSLFYLFHIFVNYNDVQVGFAFFNNAHLLIKIMNTSQTA